MNWWLRMHATARENVWERLDELAEAGVVHTSINEVWKSLKDGPYGGGPRMFQATTAVFGEAEKAGILLHPCRGVYLIADNAPPNAATCSRAQGGKRCSTCWANRANCAA